MAPAPLFPQSVDRGAQRRSSGLVGGVVISLGALIALAAGEIARDPRAPHSFFVLSLFALVSGIVCILIPWERLPARWLHAVPLLAIAEVAIGVRFAGIYGDIAANYYIFVVLFAAYALSSRRVIAGYVVLASAAASLPLLEADPHPSETIARTMVMVLLLVVVAGIVTLLREQLQQRQHDLEVLATHDPLTGVGNYRLLTERLDYEVVRHRRSGGCLTVMLLDLDGFKEINDTLGHLAGDRVLREVAAALSGTVRAQDTVARQGGDEFSILAPETTVSEAAGLAARVERAVCKAAGGRVSTSIGWVSIPADEHDPQYLLALADDSLRLAKDGRSAGRGERHAVLIAS